MMSGPQPLLRTFLTLALFTMLVLITWGMSGTFSAALPALAIWTSLAAGYGAYWLLRAWHPIRPVR